MADKSHELHQAGVKLFRTGNFEAALHKFEEALSSESDDIKRVAEIYNDIGVTYRELGDFPAAYTALDEALTRFTTLADKRGQAQTLGNRAAVHEAEGLVEEAVETYKQAAAMLEEVGENEMAMYIWQAVSRLRMKQGQYIAAIGAYEEGVDNMPEKSLKRKFLRKILKMPGSMLGGGGQQGGPEQDT